MVEAGIEVGLLIIRTGYFNAAQIIIPFVVCCLLHSFKIPVGYFRFHILLGSIHAGGGHGYFHQQFLSRLHVKSSDDAFPFFSFGHGQIQGIYDGTIELHNKKVILVHPYAVAYMSGQSLCIFPIGFATLYLRMILVFVPRRSVLKVNQYRCRVGVMIGITVQGGMGRGGQFGLHAGVGQLYGVVSGSRCFLVFGEVAAISVPGTGACSGNRHHQDVSQVHTPCSIKVCLGKSPYQGVGVHIFRAISPADSSGYGACLDHAERTAGTGKGMSVVCCSDERVNILRVVSFACLLLCCGTAEERACQYKCAKDRIGFLHRFAINKYFV